MDTKNIKTAFTGHSKVELKGLGNTPRTAVSSFNCFAVVKSNTYLRRFRLIMRDGRIVSVPYAHLPIIEYVHDQGIIISINELDITITGRGLDELENWLSDEKVLWMKESPSGEDTLEGEVFIWSIEIEEKI